MLRYIMSAHSTSYCSLGVFRIHFWISAAVPKVIAHWTYALLVLQKCWFHFGVQIGTQDFLKHHLQSNKTAKTCNLETFRLILFYNCFVPLGFLRESQESFSGAL